LRLISEVELKSVAERAPVEGLKVSLVEDTFAAEIEPDVALVNGKYLVAFVEVSSVIVVPEVTAVVVTPVINPLAFTVMVGIEVPLPKVPTLEFTVANVVALLTEVISPVRLGILVVDVAVPVNDAVIVPALKLPEASLATIVDTVLALVALDVTVNEDAPAWFAVKDAEPDKPVPETANVRAPSFAEVTAVVVTPVINPFAFTVMVGIEVPLPKVPTLLLTVANVVALLTEVISPVRLGILVVDVAVPVSAPTNVVAVIIPEELMFPTTAKSFWVN